MMLDLWWRGLRWGFEGSESAILRLRSGGVRYRGVLVVGGEEEAPCQLEIT